MNLDFLYRLALVVAILGLAAWGTALILSPALVHSYTTTGAVNSGTSGTLGAALVGLAIIMMFAAFQPRTLLLAVAIGFGLLVMMRAYMMFISGEAQANPLTLVIMAISILAAVVILIKAFDPGAERES